MYPYRYPSYFVPKTAMPGKMPSTPQMPMPPGTPFPPVPGTTAGKPVIPAAPPPPTVQPPPVSFEQEAGPPVTSDIDYTQAYLKSHIGQKVRIEFLIGTNLLTDRTGVLVEVGISYVVIRIQETDDLMLGDIYSIKFVTFLK